MSWVADAAGLATLDPDARARLDRLSPITAPKGMALFHPGETVKGFVVVLAGRIDVFLTGPTGRDILLYAVEPGQSCVQSTLGLLGGEDYSGEAVVQQDAELVLIPRETFLALMKTSERFREYVFTAFAQRMQSMMHVLEKLAFSRVEARLAQCLLERAEGGVLRATHAEIATMIGSAREVVSRRLDALEKRGVLRLDRGVVHIKDAATLVHIAESA
ncbi:MAG: Crp/Fnr family transcriptional regulator [Pseudomonadota bacterium]